MHNLSSDEDFTDYKLCGFFSTVLSVPLLPGCTTTDIIEALPSGTRCHVQSKGRDFCFISSKGIELYFLGSDDGCFRLNSERDSTNWTKSRDTRQRKRSMGMIDSSVSVGHQLHILVSRRCLKAVAAVIEVVHSECENLRASVLIDVYLPVALWSGWQFPKSASAAGALFSHISYDWVKRCSLLEGKVPCHDNNSIWNPSYCHVLECKLHCQSQFSSKKKLYKLHDIFKSLPSIAKEEEAAGCSGVKPAVANSSTGMWEMSDDILVNILLMLGPMELVRVAATCRHLRQLVVPIMPCMKLKLFPHQKAAVEWMLRRETNAQFLRHPLFKEVSAEDGFTFSINIVSGELLPGPTPVIRDFCGGMFCDEPGLGKTITALSLILKTQGTLADPPDGVEVTWCVHNNDLKCGYYEINGDNVHEAANTLKRRSECFRRRWLSPDSCSSGETKIYVRKKVKAGVVMNSRSGNGEMASRSALCSTPARGFRIQTRGQSRSLIFSCNEPSPVSDKMKTESNPLICVPDSNKCIPMENDHESSGKAVYTRTRNACEVLDLDWKENWVQCDACLKWRKLGDGDCADATAAWFCRMNSDPLYQSCDAPEELWDYQHRITHLPGFHHEEEDGGKEENVAFFTSILREHYSCIDSVSKRALTWLATLSPEKLREMGTVGLVWTSEALSSGVESVYHRIFQAFGLVRRTRKGISRWCYPQHVSELILDLRALGIALRNPLDLRRLYLSCATLVVVPSNLVEHWETQIRKHVREGQLRVYVWTDLRKAGVHNLAWDYDVVITTFSRLSVEWSPRKRSALMEVHWRRVILDEGHTLGSSLCLTNKLQMAVSLMASSRWILTGTPVRNTPNDQPSHLHAMLRFLHEEAYGADQKSWESGILRPFEAELEEGRARLLQLLSRCMISARKTDVRTIAPCTKTVTFLQFTEEHARSYNELVLTVRRNILMADWNDPSHVESLLNPKQWKFRSTTIRNVRLSCCVAGHIKVTDAGEDIQETMDILVERCGVDPASDEYNLVKHSLMCGGNCRRCGEWCRLPVITPCRHLLCLDCVSLDSEKCALPACDRRYEMQIPQLAARPENPTPKWPVPKDLIELQPSYRQDDWDPDWQSTSSSKVSHLVGRLKSLGAASGDGAEKVIVFSQFLEHIHVIERQLSVAGIGCAGMYSPMPCAAKAKSLASFRQDRRCTALVMDGSAALGLDLSFVTSVFLMEPIWDRRSSAVPIEWGHAAQFAWRRWQCEERSRSRCWSC